VLEKLGRDPSLTGDVIGVLIATNREELPAHLAGDIERALIALGSSKSARAVSTKRPTSDRSVGLPGVAGRSYWVIRASPWERAFVWHEAQRGRLRQGWGSTADQDLDVIRRVRREGGRLSDDQDFSWRSRRMNTRDPDGVRVDDLVVAPNLPEWGRLSVFRLDGLYRYEMVAPKTWGERFGHILPVELIEGDIDRRSPRVSDGLLAMLRPQSRLYNITGYGGDVELLLGHDLPPIGRGAERWGELWAETEHKVLFGRFPPTGPRPSDDRVAMLAAELGRTFDAISWQWGDGASYCSGGTASTTSEPLKAWLDRTGACEK
jgi:hypothetical protein